MTVPNRITLTRIILTPVGVGLLLLPGVPFHAILSLAVFLAAMLTDLLDGYVVRHRGGGSQLGKFLDPLSDKLLILLYFIALTDLGVYPLWLLLLFFAREFVIDGIRNFASARSRVMGASFIGKVKGFLQTLSLTLGLLALAAQAEECCGAASSPPLAAAAVALMIVSFLVSLMSMPGYLRAVRGLLGEA